MCGCTLYDSPTCGHSWISMSQPCGFLRDLLSCPNRQTYQTLIAPPYACPVCNGGFADGETMEMIQGPWGCNQMLRNHVGGDHAIPGQWGNAPFLGRGCAPLAMTTGAMIPYGGSRGPAIAPGAMIPYSGFTSSRDHRLTGPYRDRTVMGHSAMAIAGPLLQDRYDAFDDGYVDQCLCGHGSRRRRKQKGRYKYTYSEEPAGNCAVM